MLALGAAPLIYLATLALGRWLKRAHHVPLGLMFQLLCVALAAWAPLRVLRADGTVKSWQDEGLRAFHAALIILSTIFALQLLRRLYWQRWFARKHGAEAPKLLQQVFAFAVFCVAVTMVLKVAYGFRVDTFIAGSGIIAVVIGFAMQETLANIISGIALQFGKPFTVGDWLIVDSQRAEVIEMNWRSTKLRTNDDYYLDIPNKAIVSHTIVNLSYPTKVHSNRIRIGFEYAVPPNRVREILRRATANAAGVLESPPPKVYLRDFGDSAIIYEIKCSLDDERRFNDIEDAIRTNVWYEARRAGLAIPFPMRTVEIRRPAVRGQTHRRFARTARTPGDPFPARRHAEGPTPRTRTDPPFWPLRKSDPAGQRGLLHVRHHPRRGGRGHPRKRHRHHRGHAARGRGLRRDVPAHRRETQRDSHREDRLRSLGN